MNVQTLEKYAIYIDGYPSGIFCRTEKDAIEYAKKFEKYRNFEVKVVRCDVDTANQIVSIKEIIHL